MPAVDHLKRAREEMAAYQKESTCVGCKDDGVVIADTMDLMIETDGLIKKDPAAVARHPNANRLGEVHKQMTEVRDLAAERYAPPEPEKAKPRGPLAAFIAGRTGANEKPVGSSGESPRILGSILGGEKTGPVREVLSGVRDMLPRPFQSLTTKPRPGKKD